MNFDSAGFNDRRRSPEYGESLEAQAPIQATSQTDRITPSDEVVTPSHRPSYKLNGGAMVITGLASLLIVVAGLGGLFLSGRQSANPDKAAIERVNNYSVGGVTVKEVKTNSALNIGKVDRLSVNGQLKVSDTLVLSPTSVPQSPTTGQVYYDKNTNAPYYYNGTQFVSLAPQVIPQSVNSLGGAVGAVNLGSGLQITANTLNLSNTFLQSLSTPKVTSLQGQSGALSLGAGSGIGISGLTVTNTGVTGLTGTANQITVSGSSGNVNLSLPQGIAVSSNPTFAGLTLSSALGISNGGTGSNGSGFSNGGVVYYNGTNLSTSPAPGSDGLCLLSGPSGPEYAACPGGGAGISSTGTQNYIPLFGLGGNSVSNSIMSQALTTVTVAGTLAATTLTGDGSGITSLNAGNVSTGTLAVNRGGTGLSAVAAGDLLYGSAVNTIGKLTAGTNGQCLQVSAGLPSWAACPGDGVGISSLNGQINGTQTFANDTNVTISSGGGIHTLGWSGQLSVARGGTGQTTYTDGQLLIGNSSGGGLAKATLTAGSGINISNGNGTITISSPSGGTCATCADRALSNLNSVAINTSLLTGASTIDLGSGANPFRDIYLGGTATNNFRFTGTASGARTLTIPDATGTLAVSASGNIALSGAGNISFTGTLPVGNGGTGQTTYTDGQLLIGNSSGGGLAKATLTAGSGINISNGNGTITISSPSGGTCATCANTALSNLASVAINTSLLAGTTNTIDLGSTAKAFRDIYLGGDGTNVIQLTTTTPTSARTITLPDASGTVCLSTGNCLGGGGGGANSALSNLTGVAINTSLLTGASTIDLGSGANPFRDIYLGGTATNNFRLTGTSSAARTLTIPDASGTLAVSASGNIALSGAGNISFTGTLPVGNGGTGITNIATGEILYGSSSNVIGKLAAGSTGQCLLGVTSSAPTWGACPGDGVGITSLNGQTNGTQTFTNDTNVTITSGSGTHTLGWSGQLGVTRGGTGLATVTTGDLLYGSASNVIGRLSAVASGSCLISAGVGVAPTWGTCPGDGIGATNLQGAYDGGNTILTTDARDLSVTLANTATDSNFVVNVATGSTGQLKVQNNGTDVLSIGSAGKLALAVQGSGGGIQIGGDVDLYRSAAGTLQMEGSVAGSTLGINIQNTSSTGISALTFGNDIGNSAVGVYYYNSGSGNKLAIDNGASGGEITLNANGMIRLYDNTEISGLVTGLLGATISGAAINLNASSNFATNINTGTSTGAVGIGNNTGNTAVTIDSGTSAINIGAGAQARTVNVATGAADQTAKFGSTTTSSTTTIQGGTNGITLTTGGGTGDIKVAANIIGQGAASGVTGTTTGTGTDTTTLNLTSDPFSAGDVVYINNAGQDYYTRITVDPGTNSYTVSPTVTFEAGVTVERYSIQNIGSSTNGTPANNNERFFQGYFLGGVVTGAGSTTLSDGRLQSTSGNLTVQAGSGTVSLGTSTVLNSAGALGVTAGTNLTLNGTGTGTIGLGNSSTGAITIGNNSGGAIGLNAGANNISLSNGNAGTGSILVLDSSTSAPTCNAGSAGGMYYNATSTAVQICQGAGPGWVTLGTGVSNLQGAYDGGNAITTTSARDISFGLADTATDSNFLVNVATGSTSKFAVQKNGVDTFSVNTTGQLLSKNTTDSTTAFQIQNSSGNSLFTADTTGGGNLTVLNNSATIPSWSTSSNTLVYDRTHSSGVAANGYLYLIGGTCSGGGNCGGASTDVYYAKIKSNGSPDTWTALSSSLPASRWMGTSVTANGYIYYMGGFNGTTEQSGYYYAKIKSDGTLGAWMTGSTSMPGNRVYTSSATANGYVYVVGGDTTISATNPQSTVYYAKMNADGSLGSWTSVAGAAFGTRNFNSTFAANGYLYTTGGYSAGMVSTTYAAPLNASTGAPGTFVNTGTTIPSTGSSHTQAVVVNNNVYLIGGKDSSVYFTTGYTAKITASGGLGAWTATGVATLPAARGDGVLLTINGYIYQIGGGDGSTNGFSTNYYASTARASIGGTLDLVGGSSQDYTSGGTGSSLVAGNTNVIGTLQVQDQAVIAGSLSVGGTMNVTGQLAAGSDIIASGAATTTTGTTSGTGGTDVTSITLSAAGSFANGDIILVDNTGGSGQDYYTRITAGGGTTTLTVSPAVSYGTTAGYTGNATITKYTAQNIGAVASTNDYTTQGNRFFQGYFLGGVVTGAGSTTLSDGKLVSSTYLNLLGASASTFATTAGNLTLQAGSGTVTLGTSTALTATGALTVSSGGSSVLTLTSASGTISTGSALSSTNTIQGTTLNATTGLNTGSAGGTLRISSAGVISNLSMGSSAGVLVTAPTTGAISVATGTAADCFRSNGSGSAPSFQACPTGSGWNLTGNAGLTAGTNFVGTTDNVALQLKSSATSSGGNASYIQINPSNSDSIGAISITGNLPGGSSGGGTDWLTFNASAQMFGISGSGSTGRIRMQLAAGSGIGVNSRVCSTLSPDASGLTYVGTCTSAGTDVAEAYGTSAAIPDGTIVMPDASRPVQTVPEPGHPERTSTKAFAEVASARDKAIGVVSTNPSMDILGETLYKNEQFEPVGLSGRVPVRVNDQNGPIQTGDPIMLSSTPGVGAKANSAGKIIGYAITDYNGSGEGRVIMFISNSYWSPSVSDALQNGDSASFSDLNVSGNTTLANLTVTGDATIEGTLTVETIKVGNIEIDGHIVTKGAVPTSQILAAAGTSALINVDGNDSAGTISITTGSAGVAAGDLSKINFSKIFTKTPKVLLTGQDDASVSARIFPKGKTVNDFMMSTSQALAPNTTYTFDYFIVE